MVKTFASVTFEATPRIAEKIAVAQSLGTLSLALRSIADNTAELERAVAAGEVKVPGGHQPGRRAPDAAGHRQPPGRQQHDLSPPAATSRASSAAAVPRSAPSAPAMQAAGPPPPVRPRPPRRSSGRSGRCASLAATLSPSFRWELVKMTSINIRRHARLGTALAALAIGLGTVAVAAPAAAQPQTARPSETHARCRPGHRHDGPTVVADVRRVRSPTTRSPTSRSARRPRSTCSARARAKPRSIATDKSGAWSMPPTSGSAERQLGRRDAAAGDARSEHPGDPDEQPRGAHRHGRVARRRVEASCSALIRAYVGDLRPRSSAASARRPRCRSRSGQDRRSQPQPASSQIGVNLLATDTTGGFKFGVAQGRASSDSGRSAARSAFPAPAPSLARRGQVVRARHARRARARRRRRAGHDARRAEPDRAVGRNRQLPGRRRISRSRSRRRWAR